MASRSTLTASRADQASRVAEPRAREALRLAFAGGGTGGHLAPGLALVEQLGVDRELPGLAHLTWFLSGRAIEQRVLARLAAPCSRVVLPLEPRGGGAPSDAGVLLRTPRALGVARRALRAGRCEVLLGLGGFASLPAVLAARRLRIPVALLETNAVCGRATKHLARFAHVVFHATGASVPERATDKHVVIGPPLAPDALAPTATRERSALRLDLGFDARRPLLVVLGGSQGARGLNRFVTEHAASLTARGVQVLHQVGPGRSDEAAKDGGDGYRAVEYVDPVWPALRAADVALCRGGAGTLAEVAAAGLPAFVVPYPHHADHHQERNAAAYGDAFRIVPEQRLGSDTVEALCELLAPESAARRARLAEELESRVPRDGARACLERLIALRGKGSG